MSQSLFSSSINLQGLVRDLAERVPVVAGDPNSNPKWTIAVRDVLAELGRKKGLQVYCRRTEKNPDCHEWLCDVVWLRQTPAVGAELVAESEWGNPGCVQDDFEKLLSMKASVKILLFAYKTGSTESQNVWERIRSHMNSFPYHLAGEQYAFLEYHKDGCRSAKVAVESTGQKKFKIVSEEIGTTISAR